VSTASNADSMSACSARTPEHLRGLDRHCETIVYVAARLWAAVVGRGQEPEQPDQRKNNRRDGEIQQLRIAGWNLQGLRGAYGGAGSGGEEYCGKGPETRQGENVIRWGNGTGATRQFCHRINC
jgi:hypothetical protein